MSGGDWRRLKHGYTNDTSTDGRRVIKRYRGPDAELRRRRELMIYDKLAGQLPLPRILSSQTAQLELQWLPGVPGQELLEDQAEAGDTPTAALWRQRLAATQSFVESPTRPRGPDGAAGRGR